MSEVLVAMIILLCYGFVGLLFHFCLSRRCYRLTGEMPKEIDTKSEDYIFNDIDLLFFSILWFLFPLFVFYYKVNFSFILNYYNKLIKMGLEEEEIEEDLSRGAYR